MYVCGLLLIKLNVDASTLLLIFGQKSFRVIQLWRKEEVNLECVCLSSELADWILDASCLEWQDSGNHKLAFITAHNVLVIHVVLGGVVTSVQYQSEISCILYPSHYYLMQSSK